MNMGISSKRLMELVQQVQESRRSDVSTRIPGISGISSESQEITGIPERKTHTGMHGETITYNQRQEEFINLALSGQSCILLGAAGTGKTTCMQGMIAELLGAGKLEHIEMNHKHFSTIPSPAIAIISYTRRAVANIKRVLSADLKSNAMTVHKLLEYAPVFDTIQDPMTFELKKTMSFVPSRDAYNTLPPLQVVLIEESSMLSLDLWEKIEDALNPSILTQFIYIGDIQQLPPVFGNAILGFKLLELPVIELTEVYRQALESPIIRLAHRILSGVPIPHTKYASWHSPGKLTLHPWKKKLSADVALLTVANFFTSALDSNLYNPGEDIILIPYNKAFGSIELNKYIAQHIASREGKLVYEIVAGYNKHYFSVGDKILYEKEDAVITCITPNVEYAGRKAQGESVTMNYWGQDTGSLERKKEDHYDLSESNIDFLLDQAALLNGNDEEGKIRKASHTITLKLLDSGQEISISDSSSINTLLLGYVITVHKAQGSEWNKVFIVLHQSHATMISRELLYTGVTRAREELYVICEKETFTNGILSQRIKGETLEAKAEYFKGIQERDRKSQ